MCPVCGYKFQLYYHRGKENNQFVFKCKRVGSGHVRSKTILGNGPSWFARTQLEIFLFLFFFLGFFYKYPQWIILNEINRPNIKVITKDTASQHYNHLRNALMIYVESNFQKLGGRNTNTTVQIDEMVIRKRKYYRGRIKATFWVLGGVEIDNRTRQIIRMFALPIINRTSANMRFWIDKLVKPGSTMHTDDARFYDFLNAAGYRHDVVNHSQNYVDPITGVHTQNIESLWNLLRKSLPKNGTSFDLILSYLYEFMFRKNHSNIDFENFLHLLGNQNPYGERPLHYTDLEDNPSMHSDFGFIKEFIEDNEYFQGTIFNATLL